MALEQCAKSSLKQLTILGPPHQLKSYGTFIGSLRQFEALKDVHTEWDFLVPDFRNGHWIFRTLPGSLRNLKLRDEWGHRSGDYSEILNSLKSAKMEGLERMEMMEFVATWKGRPEWPHIFLHDSKKIIWPGAQQWMTDLREFGVSLIFSEEDL